MDRAAVLSTHLPSKPPVFRNTDFVEVQVYPLTGMGLLLMQPGPYQGRRKFYLPTGLQEDGIEELRPSHEELAVAAPKATGTTVTAVNISMARTPAIDTSCSPGALSARLRRALMDGLEELEKDDRCNFIVLASASPHVFSLGINLFDFEDGVGTRPTVQELCESILKSSKPSISVIEGACRSWGLEMALCTTYRLAVAGKSSFSFPEAKLAMIPSSVAGIQALVKRVGVRFAVRFLSTSELLSADQAKERGLIDLVFHVADGEGGSDTVDEGKVTPVATRELPSPVYSKVMVFVSHLMQDKVKEYQNHDGRRAQQTQQQAKLLVPHMHGSTPISAYPPSIPFDDPVTTSLIPPHYPGSRAVKSFYSEMKLWSEIRMLCAWAAHEVSISGLPRRIKAPFYLVESIRISTIRFSPQEYRQQVARLQAFYLKCTKLPETVAVQHSYHCVQQQIRWSSSSVKGVPSTHDKLLTSPSHEMVEGRLEKNALLAPPRNSVHSVGIVAENAASAAFLAAMLLHSIPNISVTVLCLRPYHHNHYYLSHQNTENRTGEEDGKGALSPATASSHRRSASAISTSSSSSSSSSEEDEDERNRRAAEDASAVISGGADGRLPARKHRFTSQERFHTMEELRSTVMDYVWLFRGAVHPATESGPDAGRSASILRDQFSAQLRIIDVNREHANGGWSNVPRSFYQSDVLFECAYPWSPVVSSDSSYFGAEGSSAHSKFRREKDRLMTEQRLRRWSFLDAAMKPECVLVTATAGTDVNVLSLSIQRHKDRLIGAFFAPRVENHAGIVEVSHTSITDTSVLEYMLHFFQRLSCYTVVVRSPVCGYVTCRILFAGLYQAHSMLLDGSFPIEVDRAVKRRLHSKMGVLALEDLWGLDWCAAVRETISAADLPKRDVEQIPREMLAAERVGRRTGQGWFTYDKTAEREYYVRRPSTAEHSRSPLLRSKSQQQHHPSPFNAFAVSYRQYHSLVSKRQRQLLEASTVGYVPGAPRSRVRGLLSVKETDAGGATNSRRINRDAPRSPTPLLPSVLPLYAWPSGVKVKHNRAVELDYIRYCRGAEILRRDVTEVEMSDRICLSMLHEAVRLLSDGVVASSRDVDLLSIYGLGFPTWTGGLLFEADQMGDPKSLLSKLRVYAFALGEEAFSPPCRAIVTMAAEDKFIHSMFP